MNRGRITAIISMLLAVFCTAALVNTWNVSRNMARVTDEALALAAEGRPDEAGVAQLEQKIRQLSDDWEEFAPIVSTYSRHDELERVTSAVRRLRPLFVSGKYDELYLTLNETRDALDHLRDTELPTISNIL